MSRRTFVAAAGVALAGCEAPTAGTAGTHSPISEYGPSVAVETLATGFGQPVAVADVPGTGPVARLVVDRAGQVYVQDGLGVREEPLLDVSARLRRESGETGLLGLALHPDFGDNRRFFVRYSAKPRDGTPEDYSHTAALEEYRATDDLRGTVEGSRRVIMEVPQPGTWHNAGDLVFGPEGYLFVALGDGGSDVDDSGPGHVEDWYDGIDGGNGQDITENLLGSILRIDIDDTNGDANEGRNYAVPEDNPLVGEEGLDEQYAWGFRNPWGMSFHDGRLYAVDVGNDSYEEVNVVEKGGNYGWNVREGFVCHGTDSCPGESPRGNPLIDPVIAYPHRHQGESFGTAIVGGAFYANDDAPALRGRYLFADLSGTVFASRPPESGGGARGESGRPWPIEVVDAAFDGVPLGIETARDGRPYLLTTDFEGAGALHRLGSPS